MKWLWPRKRKSVYLFKVYFPGNVNYLPYSAATLWAYAHKFDDIRETYDLGGLFALREPVNEAIEKVVNPTVVGFSSYCWNTRWNLKLAELIKARYPKCTIIFGGPDVPDEGVEFLRNHPQVDIAAHGEGEVTFLEILRTLRSREKSLSSVLGITYREPGGDIKKNSPRPRIKDLSQLPSPYTMGLFDEMINGSDQWTAIFESNRGCPYQCGFCNWGSLTQSKIKSFSHKIYQELDWFEKTKLRHLYFTDANFGISDMDEKLADRIVEIKQKTGYPHKLMLTWAKSSPRRVVSIARKRHNVGLLEGITLATQSENPETLKAVKRKNLDPTQVREIASQFSQNQFAYYNQLILGLPHETKESFLTGIYDSLERARYTSIDVNILVLIPNTELASPESRERYGFKTLPGSMHDNFSLIPDPELIETSEYVIATNTLPNDKWREAWVESHIATGLHLLGGTYGLAMGLYYKYQIPVRDFYSSFMEAVRRDDSFFLNGILKALDEEMMNSVRSGWINIYVSRETTKKYFEFLGARYTRYERFVAIAAQVQRSEFERFLREFCRSRFNINDEELFELNDKLWIKHGREYPVFGEFDHDWQKTINTGVMLEPKKSEFYFQCALPDTHKMPFEAFIRNTSYYYRRRGHGIARMLRPEELGILQTHDFLVRH